MIRRRPRTACVLTVALQLVVGFGVSAHLVLCYSPAGHVAVESSLGADCCAGEHPGAAALGGVDDCGGCTDTPLLRGSLDRRTADPGWAGSPSWVVVSPAPATAAGRPARPAARNAVPVASAGPGTFRRSVVLLV